MVLPPVSTVAAPGVTANQPAPEPNVMVGVIVTLPLHAPAAPTVKVCLAGFCPLVAANVADEIDGAWSVQAGCTVIVTGIVWGVPMAL